MQAIIKHYGKNEHTVNHFTTNLDKWLKGKELKFEPIKNARFIDGMTLCVVEFNKDNCIYILLPENVFKGKGVLNNEK